MARIKINLKDGTIKRSDKVLGIDLGTTNSLIAIVDQDTHQARCLGKIDDLITPSIVFINKDNTVLVGNEAKPFLLSEPQNTVYSVKRMLGRSFTDMLPHSSGLSYNLLPDDTKAMVQLHINGKLYNPIEISSFILKALKQKAELILGEQISKVVITVPAYFNDSQRQATRDAGKLAGLDVLRIVNEPTAASLAYGIGLAKDDHKSIAVYDLGGGTFDITILQIQNGVFEVLSTNGDTYTGGDDFDRAILLYWCDSNSLDLRLLEQDKSLYQEFRIKAEEAKKHLSIESEYSATLIANGQECNLHISRDIFNEQIRLIVNKTLNSCKKALKDAELNVEDIDEVVMVGGSTRIPYVYDSVKNFFKKEKLNNSLNPDEVVAMGAAIEADILAGNRKDILLLDVTPLSLGIETMGGMMDVIIPRNSKVPGQAGRQYTTSVDGQSKLKISVFQGEREMVDDNRKLAEITMENIPAMPAGLPKIDIQFILNADGILKVEATELRSGLEQKLEVKPQYGLTDKEVEKMLLSAMQYAESDMHQRMLAETKLEAKQVIYQCKKLLQNNQSLLQTHEIIETEKAIDDLDILCEDDNREAINSAMERLNHITRPFAERLMDEAIGKALTGKKLDAL